MILGLHHFGFRVDDLEKSVAMYESTGFRIFKKFESDARGLKAVMLKKGDSHVELFMFTDPDAELSKKIARHFAFASDNLEEDVERFTDQGYEVSIPISEGTVVKRFAYMQDKFGTQFELLEPLEES